MPPKLHLKQRRYERLYLLCFYQNKFLELNRFQLLGLGWD